MPTSAPDPSAIEFLRCNTWANQALIAYCETLTPEQLDHAGPGAYGSIRETLAHIVSGEASYFHILGGPAEVCAFKHDAATPLAALRAQAAEVGAALIDLAQRTPADARLSRRWLGTRWGNKKAGYAPIALFIQIVNHGAEHRTNITTILAGLGFAPPGVDGWAYLAHSADRFEIP
jgi:uncharacterized damage-inducible protein DinB